MNIRTSSRALEGAYDKPNQSVKKKTLAQRLKKGVFGRSRRRFARYSILIANLAVLVGVSLFVFNNSQSKQAGQQNFVLANSNSAVSPLDQISSADIAANVAHMTNVTEAVSAANQADSAKVLLTVSPADETIVAKPQIIDAGLKTIKDLKRYQTVSGDTVSSIAAKFGITSNSIKWSNAISDNAIGSGIWLWIPPVDGIVYVVQSGDTAGSIAVKFSANKEAIIAFNDAEIGGLKVGQRIVVPKGKRTDSAPTINASPGIFFLGNAAGGYDYGWCTYYAAAKGGAPGGWGNANTWHIYAGLSGWTVSTVPKKGAIAQTSSGWAGHVGIVEDVRVVNGQYQIKYSDMNGLAGFNRVGYSDWVPALGKYQRFIYH